MDIPKRSAARLVILGARWPSTTTPTAGRRRSAHKRTALCSRGREAGTTPQTQHAKNERADMVDLSLRYPPAVLAARKAVAEKGSFRERVRFDLVDRPQHA